MEIGKAGKAGEGLGNKNHLLILIVVEAVVLCRDFPRDGLYRIAVLAS